MERYAKFGAFAGLAALVGAVVAFLFLLGPLGWPFAALLLVAVYGLLKYSGYLDSNADPVEKTNCSACGARNGLDREGCHHCGEPLDAVA